MAFLSHLEMGRGVGQRWPGDIFIYKILLESPLLIEEIFVEQSIDKVIKTMKDNFLGGVLFFILFIYFFY